MRLLLKAFILLLFYSYGTEAQTDTLVIKLKNNQIEKIAISNISSVKFENVTSVNEPTKKESCLSVKDNYPNPFQEQTNIEFEIAYSGDVVVIIYDNSGKEINKLECNNCQIGKNSLSWNCLDTSHKRVENGVYYYEVRFNNETQSKKMLLVK